MSSEQIKTQARQDARDEAAGHKVRCPYDPATQPDQFNTWAIEKNAYQQWLQHQENK